MEKMSRSEFRVKQFEKCLEDATEVAKRHSRKDFQGASYDIDADGLVVIASALYLGDRIRELLPRAYAGNSPRSI